MIAAPRRVLIVNADDYCLSEGVSAGIRHAHLHGVVTSTTVMVNRPLVAEQVRQAQRDCPALGLGVHLVLTMGKPLYGRFVPSLHDADGGFPKLPQWTAERWNRTDPEELFTEWRGQVQFLADILGHAPTHVDSHHHAAYLHPTGLRAITRVAAEFGIPLRNPTGITAEDKDLGLGGPALPAAFTSAPHPVGLISTLPEERIIPAIIRALPQGGIIEAMCHPAHMDAELGRISSYALPRERELSVLIRPTLRSALVRAGIELGTFKTLTP